MMDKKVIGNCQQRFIGCKSWPTDPITSQGEMVGSVGQGRAYMQAVLLHFSKAFDRVSCSILVAKWWISR